ncbi:mediator of RNA polymerase II transcription subunit 27-like [Vespa mandarinia]|uniref:mediator of RNA polymerase II transcription subunit 27-like n=1 Tax=Vespa mandarinia TaxID=7446 RepID=UPI00161014E7|nr:mediator of RNA polymerase II transcription subunit 27-like [Vespa mandarinia]
MEQLEEALLAIIVLRTSVDQFFGVFLNNLHEENEYKHVVRLQGLMTTININLRNLTEKIKILDPLLYPLNLGSITDLDEETAEQRQVNSMITTLNQLFDDMTVSVSKSVTSIATFDVILGHVLKAVIVIRGIVIEWVVIKGYEESMDLWTQSRHKVFRKVTENALAAMLHFYSTECPELAVQSFMIWLHSLINLFIEPCKHCGLYLKQVSLPTWRDFNTYEAYHEECKSCDITEDFISSN